MAVSMHECGRRRETGDRESPYITDLLYTPLTLAVRTTFLVDTHIYCLHTHRMLNLMKGVCVCVCVCVCVFLRHTYMVPQPHILVRGHLSVALLLKLSLPPTQSCSSDIPHSAPSLSSIHELSSPG